MTRTRPVFRYRICNWHQYNRALINRGRLTVWCDEHAVAAWRNLEPAAGPGAPRTYSDLAMLLYHVVCAAKYRRVIFSEQVDKVLREAGLEIAKRYELVFRCRRLLRPRSHER